jgi:lipopolysaccharide export system protein LptC
MTVLRQALDRLTLYLPVVLMGILAMATYWLVRSTPLLAPAMSAITPPHLPDYFMRNFAVKTFDAKGQLKSEVSGGEAHHFPDTGALEIAQVRIRSFDKQGRLSIATARQAVTNEDASEVQLMGAAKVVREPSLNGRGVAQPVMTFSGEYLHVFVNTERVESSKPVVLTRGQDRFTANTMSFDNRQRMLLLQGRVRGSLVPTTP